MSQIGQGTIKQRINTFHKNALKIQYPSQMNDYYKTEMDIEIKV